MAKVKRVAIIGSGISGLNCIKSLKEERIEPVCFEKTSHWGGLWRYRDEATDGIPSLMWSTIINHSKELGAFSNFPPPKESANYMRHHELYQYFKKYIEHFDLLRYITCKREVTYVKKATDYAQSGRWEVTVRNTETGEIYKDIFDGVMVCIGLNSSPKLAKFTDMDTFKGKIIHSHDLKKIDEFHNKRVVVIGIGCSALDAAVEISNVAKQVYLSTRSKAWIVPRTSFHGLPFDTLVLRRCFTWLINIRNGKLASNLVQTLFLNPKFNHRLYNMEPNIHVLGRDPSVNDYLAPKLISGSVILRDNVKCFTENGVIFDNEEKVTECDAVVMATGYKWQFPFLEDGVIRYNDGRFNLYKCVYPTHLPHPTLAVVGFFLPYGAGFPINELQARWAAYLLKGHGSLPNQKEMMEDAEKRYEENCKRYMSSELMSVRVDYVQFQDELASQIGVKPNFIKLATTDPVLCYALIFGPSLPYQYRLTGPHNWSGARHAILTAKDRIQAPLRNSEKTRNATSLFSCETFIKYFLLISVIGVLMTWKDLPNTYFSIGLIVTFLIMFKSRFIKHIFLILLPAVVLTYILVDTYLKTLMLHF